MSVPSYQDGNIVAQVVLSGQTVTEGDLVQTSGAAVTIRNCAAQAASSVFAGVALDTVVGDGTKTVQVKKTGLFCFPIGASDAWGTNINIGTEVLASDATHVQGSALSNAVKVGKAVKCGPTTASVWVRIDGYAA